nr:ATP synthase protein 8 [Polyplax reclinata]
MPQMAPSMWSIFSILSNLVFLSSIVILSYDKITPLKGVPCFSSSKTSKVFSWNLILYDL